MPALFISYSHEDAAFVEALHEITDIIGYTSWRDKLKISGGLDFSEEIARGIEDCPIFMPLFSPDYFKSSFCEKELAYARTEEKYIFPVILEGDVPPDLEVLHQIRLDCDDRKKVTATALAQVIKELREVLKEPDTIPTRFPEGSDPIWTETLEQDLIDTRWSWCDNHECIGDNWIEFCSGNRVVRSWARHMDGYWEVLENGLVRFGPHVIYVDIENRELIGSHGDPREKSPERSGRFLHHVNQSGILG